MIPRRKRDEHRLCRICRTCGAELTRHFDRWTQCSLCYWKARLENSTPLETLLKDRSDTGANIQVTENALNSLESEQRRREETLRSNAPWWKKILGVDSANEELEKLRPQVWSLRGALLELRRDLDRLESAIKTARHVRKRFDSAIKDAARRRKLHQQQVERKRAFDECSRDSKPNSYERSEFVIRKKDYKRGNPLDNHFRNGFRKETLSAFGNKCLFCGSTHDLTLDHFGIPKNEGGNFVLLLQDKSSIRMNLVVLCRSCNAAKGELPYDHFFGVDKLREAEGYQRRLLQLVLADSNTMEVIKSWYEIRVR